MAKRVKGKKNKRSEMLPHQMVTIVPRDKGRPYSSVSEGARDDWEPNRTKGRMRDSRSL